DAGDYRVTRLEAFNIVEVARALSSTRVGIPYSMFSANSAGGVQLPLVRITRVELLDSSGQPAGSTIPYAERVDAQSRAFESAGRGVKIEVSDATLGVVTQPAPGGTFAVGGGTMKVGFLSGLTTYPDVEVTFTAGDKPPAQVVAAINSAATTAF